MVAFVTGTQRTLLVVFTFLRSCSELRRRAFKFKQFKFLVIGTRKSGVTVIKRSVSGNGNSKFTLILSLIHYQEELTIATFQGCVERLINKVRSLVY